MTTRTFQTNITTEIFSADGDKSISISELGLTLKRDILTTPIETIITPLDITDVNTGNVITMDRLTYLPTGLGALTVPTDGFTCNFNDAIQVQDYNATLSPPVSHSEAKLGANPLGLYGLQFTSTETIATSITNDNGNDLNVTGSNQLNLASTDNVNINAGVNCIINVPSGGNSVLLNTQDGIVNMGDYNQIYNRTYYSLNDATKEIITNTPDGLIWSGDVNALGSNTTVQLNINKSFQSVFSGRMSKTEEINITVGNHAEAYSNYFTTDADVRFYPRIDYENPLTPNGDGWFCYITNITGSDINMTADDGLQFVSRSMGGFNTTGIIGKFETVRVSLCFHTTTGYFWAVLQGS